MKTTRQAYAAFDRKLGIERRNDFRLIVRLHEDSAARVISHPSWGLAAITQPAEKQKVSAKPGQLFKPSKDYHLKS